MSTPGEKRFVTLPSGNEYVMERGNSVWEFRSPTAEDVAYVQANARPVGASGNVWPGTATASVVCRVVTADPVPSSYRDLSWDAFAGGTVSAYRVYYTELPGGVETFYQSYGSTVLSARVADLSAEKSYLFRVEAEYATTASGTCTGSTGLAPARVLQEASAIPALFLAGEVLSPGIAPQEGAIDVAGTTFHGMFYHYSATIKPTIYGVRAALLNQRGVPISGGAMMFSTSQQWDGEITGDPTTGWQYLTVNGDTTLPVPAASSDAEGMAFADAIFPVPITSYATWYVRFFHPGQGESTDYSFGYTVVPTGSYVSGVLTSNIKLQVETYDVYHIPKIYRGAGRAIEIPSTISQATFELAKSPNAALFCQAPGPCSLPFIQLQFFTEAP